MITRARESRTAQRASITQSYSRDNRAAIAGTKFASVHHDCDLYRNLLRGSRLWPDLFLVHFVGLIIWTHTRQYSQTSRFSNNGNESMIQKLIHNGRATYVRENHLLLRKERQQSLKNVILRRITHLLDGISKAVEDPNSLSINAALLQRNI